MLHLKQADVPRWPFGKLAVFATPDTALRHMCDHILTRPEAHYWSLLIPAYDNWVEAENDDALYRFARALWSSRPPASAAQELYEGYGNVIVQAIGEAILHGWYWVEEEVDGLCYRGMGTTGVYVIWRENTVQTAMVLGYAAPPGEHPTPTRSRRKDPLPRQHTWRYRGARLRQEEASFPLVKNDLAETTYHTFKKSARRLRKEYKNACHTGQVGDFGSRLGSLLGGVPDFQTWQELRSRRQPAPAPAENPALQSPHRPLNNHAVVHRYN